MNRRGVGQLRYPSPGYVASHGPGISCSNKVKQGATVSAFPRKWDFRCAPMWWREVSIDPGSGDWRAEPDRADGCRICFRSMQNYPAVFICGLHGFPWYRAGVPSRPPAPWHCFAYRFRRLPGGTGWRRTAALQDDQAKDVAMMEMVIPVSSAMSWARVIE